MDESRFWEIIELSRGAARSPEEQVRDIAALLATAAPDEIRGFDRQLGNRFGESNRHEIWAAGYLINGGCSDDGFLYFCGWLILQGRDRFTRAVRDADSIAEWIEPSLGPVECEALLYVANEAYEVATGEDMPPDPWAKMGEPAGKPWDEDDVENVLPRLAGKLGG